MRNMESSIMRNAQSSLKNLLPVISFAKPSDVDKYLKLYNIDLDSGKYRCAMCGDIVTRENIYALIAHGSSIKLICNKPSCQAKFSITSP